MQAEKYIEEFVKIWLGCSTEFPSLGSKYSYNEKLSCEARLEEFLKKIKRNGERFDPNLTSEDIFQASRNVWIINSIQSMMGMPVKLTPSIFAYSMLYPYTDNYLDNPDTASENKVTFSQRFQQRIKGKKIIPEKNDEKKIFDLIGMIEEEYDRKRYPEVYEI